MTPELKAKWVTALRDGSHQQARDKLRSQNGYCCLGVLCNVVNPHGWVEAGTWLENDDGYSSSGDLSMSALRSFGLTEEIQRTLIKMNDGYKPDIYDETEGRQEVRRHSFDEIAAWIEKNVP